MREGTMKKYIILSFAFLTIFIGNVVAHEGEEHKDSHGKMAMPASDEKNHEHASTANMGDSEMLSPVWHKIRDTEKKIEETLKAGNLGPIHDLSGEISDLVKELVKRTTKEDLADDQMQKVTTSVQRLDEIADLMHEYADNGNQVEAEKQLQKLSKILDYIEDQYGENN